MLSGIDEKIILPGRYVLVIPRKKALSKFHFSGLMLSSSWMEVYLKVPLHTDTQCGFMAFNAEVLRKILFKAEERTFSFDIELMILVATTGKLFAHAPIYWHDSLNESNFWKNRNQTTHLNDQVTDPFSLLARFYRR